MSTTDKIFTYLQERLEQAQRRLNTLDRNIKAEINKVRESNNLDSIIDSADELKALRRERCITHTEVLAFENVVAAIERVIKKGEEHD